jgi:UDP-N-acetyl-D-glucosamine dehydrogenase
MDPYVPSVSEHGLEMDGVDPSASFTPYDVVVIVTDHAVLDRERLLREAQLVVDTRDALRGVPGDHGKVRML